MAGDYKVKVKKEAPVDPETGIPRFKNPLSDLESAQKPMWWQVPPKTDDQLLASMLVEREHHLDVVQQSQRWGMAFNFTMYSGANAESLLSSYGLPSVMNWTVAAELGGPVHNVVASNVDTVTAKITLNKPKATYTTREGDYGQRLRAEGMTDFAAGLFQQIKIYPMRMQLTSDALVWGAGILKIVTKGEGKDMRIVAERTIRPSLKVDEAEAYRGKARQMYQREIYTRGQMIDEFGDTQEKMDIIMSSPMQPEADYFFPGGDDFSAELVEKIEGWYLPDSKGNGGRHVIATRSGVLLDEPWTRKDFPFVILRWKKPKIGFWGDSFASALRGYQLKINRLDRTIDETMRRMSLGRWMIAHGSKVSPMHLGNQLGSVIRYQGQKPIIDNSNTVPPELPTERDAEIQKSSALNGVSTMDAQSVVPANLKSGEALKVHEDINTERFNEFEDAYEQFFLDVAEAGIDLIRDLADHEPKFNYKVLIQGRRDIREMDWRSVAMKKEDYTISVAATNYMSGDPAQQIDKATTLSAAAGLDIVETIDALHYADVDTATFPKVGPLRYVRWSAWKMSRNKYVKPTEDVDFVHGIPLMRATKQQLIMDGAPQETISLFDQWLEEANVLQKQAATDAMKLQSEMQAQQQSLQAAVAALQPPPIQPAPVGAPQAPQMNQLLPSGGAQPNA